MFLSDFFAIAVQLLLEGLLEWKIIAHYLDEFLAVLP